MMNNCFTIRMQHQQQEQNLQSGEKQTFTHLTVKFLGSPGVSSSGFHGLPIPEASALRLQEVCCRGRWGLGQQLLPALASWLKCPPIRWTLESSSCFCYSLALGLCQVSGCQVPLEKERLIGDQKNSTGLLQLCGFLWLWFWYLLPGHKTATAESLGAYVGWQGRGEGQPVWGKPEGPFQGLQRGQRQQQRRVGAWGWGLSWEVGLLGGCWQSHSRVTKQSWVCGAKAWGSSCRGSCNVSDWTETKNSQICSLRCTFACLLVSLGEKEMTAEWGFLWVRSLVFSLSW